MKFLFWTIVIFFVLRWLLKPFLKVMVIKSAQKMAENMQQQYSQQQQPRYPEGSIHVDHIPDQKTSKKINNSPKDDYIDFEEVK
ncbi:DUF4834 family protein [Cytophaga hutchinsonii]|uniref:DUF4834 domain-containing protein n=1 Tax=Cytophaga hutchinsonii (strain ATCC 33406 / DSM 1761 / CIP 103989 / NBRC 15051 / NCIMB 9469 / D465) TaxID=269798 RepID=A0A6N4SVM7_CYTH3|nr:DUF4834 family protein [Cytophaga hutchinsonii]ABG60519.1 hypothetical protein CHU_3280 [Cytophaga hutchinsonii ATCC 33406]